MTIIIPQYQTLVLSFISTSSTPSTSSTTSTTSTTSGVLHVLLKHDKTNAMNRTFWKEFHEAFTWIKQNSQVRVVLLSGHGRMFSSGLDFADHTDFFMPSSLSSTSSSSSSSSSNTKQDIGRRSWQLLQLIETYQAAFQILEQIPQPVVAAVHGAAVGGAVDLLTATDIRYCSEDAYFVIKEIDVGMTADVGTLQRLHTVVGSASTIREWALTGRKISAREAAEVGFVTSPVFKTPQECFAHALSVCEQIALKSPLAIVGTKRMLLYARDHGVAQGIHSVALWNMSMLQSEDLSKSIYAQMKKQLPIYANL
jgi:enoyl-CoA hydratase/carnithine racemase